VLVPGLLLLLLACPTKDRAAWDWRGYVRRIDGSEVVLPAVETSPVMLVFSSSWATPCAPLLTELAGLSDRARVLVVQADPASPAMAGDSLEFEVLVPTGDELVERMDVQVLPTVVLFDRSGRRVEKFEGYSTEVVARIGEALDKLTEIDE
jgi:thioredoxin-like negative regulator of GroEL